MVLGNGNKTFEEERASPSWRPMLVGDISIPEEDYILVENLNQINKEVNDYLEYRGLV